MQNVSLSWEIGHENPLVEKLDDLGTVLSGLYRRQGKLAGQVNDWSGADYDHGADADKRARAGEKQAYGTSELNHFLFRWLGDTRSAGQNCRFFGDSTTLK